MKSLAQLAFVSLMFLTPAFASAQVIGSGPYQQTVNTGYSVGFISNSGGFGMFSGGGQGIGGVAGTILYIINSILVPTLFAISFIVFLYGIYKSYILSHGEAGEVKEGHQVILWGIIGFVAMVSLWGLVNVVAATFGLTGVGAPMTPVSYPGY